MWKAAAQHHSPIPVPNDSNQQNNNSEKQHNQQNNNSNLTFIEMMLCGATCLWVDFLLVWLCFVVGVPRLVFGLVLFA